MKSTDAMLELYQLQASLGPDAYINIIWAMRYPDSQQPYSAPKSAGSWPIQRVQHSATVTKLKRGK